MCHQTLKSNIQTRWREFHITWRWWTLCRMELYTTFRRKVWETICVETWMTREEETAHHSSLPIHPPINDLPRSLILSQKSLNTKKISEFLLWLSGHSLKWIEIRGICTPPHWWQLEKKKKKSFFPSISSFIFPACWIMVTTGIEKINASCWRK